jgi:hypothetical protein
MHVEIAGTDLCYLEGPEEAVPLSDLLVAGHALTDSSIQRFGV